MRLIFRQRNPETRKMQDIQKCIRLMRIGPKSRYDFSDRLLLENATPRAVRTKLVIMQSSLRKQLFSDNHSEFSDKERREFVELTGVEMLSDSARSSRYYEHPEYLNHVIWTAENCPKQEMRVKALAHLALIARDMNYGEHPPQQTPALVNDRILGIKNILYRSLGIGYSYLTKTFIHEPKRVPDFQRWASGIAKWVMRAGLVLTPVYFAVGYMDGGMNAAKSLTVIGVSAAIYSTGVVLKNLSKKFLSESRLMESFIRKALKQQEWDKRVRA